jgi:hypothetical protein
MSTEFTFKYRIDTPNGLSFDMRPSQRTAELLVSASLRVMDDIKLPYRITQVLKAAGISMDGEALQTTSVSRRCRSERT